VTTATLTWTNPTARIDGSPLDPSDILFLEIFDDTGDGSGPVLIGSPTGPDTDFTTQALAVGSHTFTVVVNDTTGHKSTASNAAVVTVPATQAIPEAVVDLAAVLNP